MLSVQIEKKQEHKRKRFELTIPEKWAEVGRDLILRISPFLLIDSPGHRIEIVRQLIGKKIGVLFYYLTDEQLFAITETIGWMFVDSMDEKLMDFFKVKGEKYFLPGTNLEDCVAIEYAYADFYFEKVAKGDSSSLSYLIASLCRPIRADYNPDSPEYDGNKREKFNPVLIDKRAKLIEESLTLGEKMYFLLYFIGAKKRMKEKYNVLFREREGEDIISLTPDFGVVGLIWDVAGSIIEEGSVQYTNLHNLFTYLTKKYYDNIELERRIKHANPVAI